VGLFITREKENADLCEVKYSGPFSGIGTSQLQERHP